MRSLARVPPAALVCTLALTGCDVDGEGNAGYAVRDSAGIEIVESFSPQWDEGRQWRVQEAPILSIGSALGGDPAAQFSSIGGLAKLDDGRIVVLDEGSAELRFFDSTGAHLRTVGRRGEGPGEFSGGFLALHRLPGDSLLVTEPLPLRQSLFAPSGEFVRIVPGVPVAGSRMPAIAAALFADGTPVVTPIRPIARRTGAWLDSMDYFVGSGTDSAVLLGRFPLERFTGDGSTLASLALGARGRFAVAGDRFYHGFPDRYEIGEYTRDGSRVRLIRRRWSPVTIPESVRDAFRDSALASAESDYVHRRLAITEYAETFPAYEELRTDRAGHLWVRAARTDESALRLSVRRYGSPEWSIFDTSGTWLGDVRLPAGFDVREIGEDYLAGVRYDAADVPQVRIYQLMKP